MGMTGRTASELHMRQEARKGGNIKDDEEREAVPVTPHRPEGISRRSSTVRRRNSTISRHNRLVHLNMSSRSHRKSKCALVILQSIVRVFSF